MNTCSDVRRLVCAGMVAAGVVAGLGLTGCATVEPWERGQLADYKSRPDRDPLVTVLDDHVYFTREAATGGRGVGGGGCGCN